MTWRAFAAVLFCLCAAGDARATLGGDSASVALNQTRLGATRKIHKLAWGERHELELPSHLRVHEYLSPAGAVYAIAWRGARMPDLRELLGPYFAQLKRRGGSHHSLVLNGADLVVQSHGHGHRFAGRAWVPSLVPAGVDVDVSVGR